MARKEPASDEKYADFLDHIRIRMGVRMNDIKDRETLKQLLETKGEHLFPGKSKGVYATPERIRAIEKYGNLDIKKPTMTKEIADETPNVIYSDGKRIYSKRTFARTYKTKDGKIKRSIQIRWYDHKNKRWCKEPRL